ncbi:MAG: putative phage tail protein [Akkermansiaceae bacterium]|nr:putative phage tail protein [Akkermansiaceae bacterium]
MGIETSIGATIIAGTSIAGTTAGTLAALAINIAISAALSAAASAIATKVAGDGPSKATRTGNIKQPLTPHEWVYGSVRKGGAVFYVNGSGGSNWVLHMCIAFAAHEIESFDEIYINGELCGLDLIKPSDYASVLSAEGPFARWPNLDDSYQVYVPAKGFKRRALVAFQFREGTEDQVPVPFQVFECSNWTAAHQAKSRAYLYARLLYEETGKAWPSFIPAFTARVKGKRLYDPRNGLTVWSDNTALIAADILENLMFVPRSRIDATALIEAANVCDETVPLKGGGSEKRYRGSGYLVIEGEPEDWVEPVCKAMAGAVIEHHGVYYIHAGTWRAPTLSISDADVMGVIRVRTATSDKDRANVCRGMFAGVDSYDQPTDFPQVSDPEGIAEDGFEQSMEVNLEWVPSHTQAQRIAKILLLTQRAGRTVEIGTTLLKGLDVKPWDTVSLSLRSFGITGTFRVVDHHVEIEGGALQPTLTLQESSPAIYAWDAETEQQGLKVDASMIPGTDIEPDNLAFTTAIAISAGTFNPATITAVWDDPGNTSFAAIEVEAILHFQYRIGAGTWTDAVTETKGEAAPGAETLALAITDESFGAAAYSFQGHQVERVRIRTRINPFSWSDWVVVDGDLQAPTAISKAVTNYTTRIYHQPALVKMAWGAPTNGTPASYEVEVTLTYDWKQGANPYITTTYTERKTLKARSLNLQLWDKSKPNGSTQFQNHVLNQARVRAISTDGTVSSWTVL